MNIIKAEGVHMKVLLEAVEPVLVYRVVNGEGLSVGEVIQPSAAPTLARGAGTVLLVRPAIGNRRERGSAAA
jgi:hypothetical protein